MAIYLYLATAIGLFIATQTNGKWRVVVETNKRHQVAPGFIGNTTY